MSTTLLSLYDGALAAGVTTVYTVPALTKAVIRACSFCNTTAGVVALTVKLTVRSGGTARTIVSARPVAVGATDPCPELINRILEPGGLIALAGLNIEGTIDGTQVVEHA